MVCLMPKVKEGALHLQKVKERNFKKIQPFPKIHCIPIFKAKFTFLINSFQVSLGESTIHITYQWGFFVYIVEIESLVPCFLKSVSLPTEGLLLCYQFG